MKPGEINSLFKNLSKAIKNPKSDLKYKNKFTLLVSVVLSAQCTDINVNNVTKNIYPKYNKPEHFVKLGRKKIEKLIKSIGLFRNKAKSIYFLSNQLIEKHNKKVPKNFDDLYALPGVGNKTASVVLNEGFGLPTIAVDTHVFRISNRTGLAYGKNPNEVQQNLYKVVPAKYLKKAGHTLLLHGRYTCKARAPSCKTCVIIKYCKYKNKELA
ncbi:MAG: endonuclease III [Pelagibacteraceae bacterium]|jgi:endonuclease-3|nr:endonuclease III [Pelagibacteraceae bacterium]|tara:strand:- start:164 stop:799 length:636 start_codon:yes stop_codon:yes gene_type:complete